MDAVSRMTPASHRRNRFRFVPRGAAHMICSSAVENISSLQGSGGYRWMQIQRSIPITYRRKPSIVAISGLSVR